MLVKGKILWRNQASGWKKTSPWKKKTNSGLRPPKSSFGETKAEGGGFATVIRRGVPSHDGTNPLYSKRPDIVASVNVCLP